MQAVLSPVVGRLSDVLDRKWIVSICPLIAFAGAVVSARADSMTTLIGGGVLIGMTLPTTAVLQSIQAEVMPLKYRAVASTCTNFGAAIGTL